MSSSERGVEVVRCPDGVSGVVRYRAVDGAGAPIPGPCAAVLARTHGNEPLGDPVLERLAVAVAEDLVAGSVLAIRCNERAAELGLRHTPEGSDLNRLWDPAQLERIRALPASQRSYEEQRVADLSPFLLSCDAILDLHSTSRPAAPFLVFRDDQAHATLALQLGVEHLVTGVHDNGVLSGGMAANIGLGAGERGPRIGFVFEAGQHTDPANGERAWKVAQRFLAGLGIFARRLPPTQVQARVYETTERFLQSSAGIEPYRFVGFVGGEPGGGRHGLPPRQLHSFEEIQADEVVLRRGRSEVVRADTPFTMLMPAPTTPPGTDLYYICQRREGGLTFGVPRSDAEARREAVAVERMLDLLGDDELERGTTWAAFDTRRLFDLCASVIGHQLRLRPGDPHRRITVVGRGDTGVSDQDRRAGIRYRQAMRAAVSEGLPVERIQLLRGAPLAWLDTLTSGGMMDLLARRRAATGEGGGVRMRISLRRPHTVSLLVGGDLDHALATGDRRGLRVLLLVEAATVEADGPTARVKVVRTGLVSTRLEVTTAVGRLLETLRAEHLHHVRHGALRAEPGLDALLLDDDAFEARPDPEAMEDLRSALHRTQIRMWCDALRPEIREPVRLSSPEDLGRWLARTMSATGILDAEALSGLLVRPDGAGWRVDPETVERLHERASSRSSAAPPSPSPGAPPAAGPVLQQPTFARDVTADDLERWVGWTRFLRGVQNVPDTRGKDLDLAFHAQDIQERLGRWYSLARRLAAASPGDVRVVVAGDGLNPGRDAGPAARAMTLAHRALVQDPNVHYLRLQHAQGTHLAWMKDLVDALAARPPGSASAALQLELEHGATLGVALVMVRDPESPAEPETSWSLDGWEIVCCGTVLSGLESVGADDHQLGLFTERPGGEGRTVGVCQELLHFGRAHCEGLLTQAGARVGAASGPPDPGEVGAVLVDQLARWIDVVRGWRKSSGTVPVDSEERGRWVAARLGLADLELARALADRMDDPTPSGAAAAEVWSAVRPWAPPERAEARVARP